MVCLHNKPLLHGIKICHFAGVPLCPTTRQRFNSPLQRSSLLFIITHPRHVYSPCRYVAPAASYSLLTIHTAPALRAKAVPRVASLVSKRNVNDLSITSPPNPSASVRPAIRYGPPTGGRSSDSGRTVAVFGSTGFLARYLIQKLARQGTQVIVPYRDEDEKRRLRPCGDLGQIVPLEWDARIPEQTAECVKHADVVYNLVGRDYETR